MNFHETLIITIIDKAGIGVLLLVGGFLVNRSVEKFKANEALKAAFAPLRAAGYKELWSLTQDTSPTAKNGLDLIQRKTLHDSLKIWYYQNGGAIFLSLKAADLFIKAKDDLLKPEIPSEGIRERFSSLRTELKIDLGIYKPEERDVQIGTAEAKT